MGDTTDTTVTTALGDITGTTGAYLRIIWQLDEEGIVPIRARIAERIGHTSPAVSQAIARIERQGLVHVREDGRVTLSPSGRSLAAAIVRKHRLAELLLSDVIGLPWEEVHREASRWAHDIGDDFEHRLTQFLGDPHRSLYGNPIPRSEEASGSEPRLYYRESVSLAEVAIRHIGTSVSVRIEALAEPAQADPQLLQRFAAAQITPNTRVRCQHHGSTVSISPVGVAESLTVTHSAAHLVLVSSDPDSQQVDRRARWSSH
ncbi:MAG: metal-dependent transcriptional regulator [Leucobacter sp.]